MKKELIKYLPFYLREYREVIYIFKATEPELIRIENERKRIKSWGYIFTTDEYGISKYEEELGIKNNDSLDLLARQLRVYSKFANIIPYTKRTVAQMVFSIIPEEFASIEIIRKQYKVTVDKQYKEQGEYLKDFLEDILPLNMTINIEVKYNREIDVSRYTESELSQMKEIEIREKELV